ncbi:M protein trans-acting positive regulator [Enterococcus faecalis 13-SD-W-01]|nr:M protein trans-acting positive regulator [Enterococcus faecalis 13-SD-W-01]
MKKMELLDLLDASERRKAALLKYIIQSGGKTTIAQASQQLGADRNTIKEAVSSLIDDFYHSNLEIKLALVKEKIELDSDGSISLIELLFPLYSQSKKYQLLLYLFLNGETTADDAIDNLLISRATLFRKTKELNQLMNAKNLGIKSGKFIGSERQIRYFFYSLFTAVMPCYMIRDYFSIPPAKDLSEKIIDKFGTSLEDFSVLKIQLWVFINAHRDAQGYYLETREGEEFELIEAEKLSIFFEENEIVLAEKSTESSRKLLAIFLFANFILPSQTITEQLLEKMPPLFLDIIQLFSSEIEQMAPGEIDAELLAESKISLFQILLGFSTFDTFFHAFNSERFHTLIEEYINKEATDRAKRLVQQTGIILQQYQISLTGKEDLIPYLFYRYSVLISNIQLIYSEKIKVGLDLPFERSVGHAVLKLMESRFSKKLNLEITAYDKREQYDLVLTIQRKKFPEQQSAKIYIFLGVEYEYDTAKIDQILQEIEHTKIKQAVKSIHE